MSTLNFIITDAGRQAAINADAMGIKLTITEVGYGTGNWSPDKTATALQNEFKRLPAGGGENPAPWYVHIAVTDQSSDAYQANEVGIYAGDVLFAIWSKGLEPELDGPGKINTGDSAFVFDLLLENVPLDSVTVGDANFSVPLSTETVPGIIQRATMEDMLALLNDDAVTVQKFKAWWISVKDGLTDRIVGNEIYFLGKEDPRFFNLNGSTIPNGVIDYPRLAASNSPFITISGLDIILMDMPDFLRGKGSSDREIGEFQSDEIKSHDHNLQDHEVVTETGSGWVGGVGSSGNNTIFRTSFSGGIETRPKSRTTIFGIWHGEVLNVSL